MQVQYRISGSLILVTERCQDEALQKVRQLASLAKAYVLE